MARGRRLTRIRAVALDPAAKPLYLDWDAKALRGKPGDFPKLTSADLFSNRNYLEVELGCGSGEYLVWLAGEARETNFLGIEVSRRAAQHAANLAADAGLSNIRILRADFKLLAPLLPTAGWFRVYLHFPDPVHKPKDEKRTLFTPAFLDAMARTLAAGGELSVASDKEDYFFRMLEHAEGDARFEKAHPQRYLKGLDASAKSRFQRFWERKGILPLRFILRRI